jgi:hypothetical protein
MIALLVVALLAGIASWYWVQSQPPAQRRSALLRVVLFGAGGLVLLAMLTGRLYLVLALLAALLPLLKKLLPGLLLGRILRGGIPGMGTGRGKGPQPGNQSRVATDILEMQLDHDSGDMHGRILAGPMAGRALADLSEAEFLELLHYCRGADADSARLLESYLDRRFGDSWRADDPQAGEEDPEQGRAAGSPHPMSEADALDILALAPGATREEVIQAHRQMMQKLHPDRGGSTYLAALVNEAKSILLAGREP